MMKILDGKKLKEKILGQLKQEVTKLKEQGTFPKLTVVQVGNNQASNIYIKHKQIACEKIGVESQRIVLNEKISFEDFAKEIEKLNQDKKITGILIQFPLPKQLKEEKVVELIDPKKDVDALHPTNQGKNIFKNEELLPTPCTPSGIITLLKEYKISLESKHIVVIGRSKIVGMPLTFLLTKENATISHINSRTSKDTLKYLIKNADIVVSATGAQDLFKPKDVKKDVILVDVGIIREKNQIRGDIDLEKFKNVASFATPVPGGVGPMTVATLMQNVVLLAKKQKNSL